MWKIISNAYPTKVFREKIKIEFTNICETCNEIDYREHFFFSCKNKIMWYEIEKDCFRKGTMWIREIPTPNKCNTFKNFN